MKNATIDLCTSICLRLVEGLNMERNFDSHITLPLYRYIMMIPYSIPVSHIVLGERPYMTNILPYVASAMSYDQNKQLQPTPSVQYLAQDMVLGGHMTYNDAVAWFRDSWKYVCYGVVLLNVCTYEKFMESSSERERVLVEQFVRDISLLSYVVSGKQTHIHAMGNPAKHSAQRIASSISKRKLVVSMHYYPNPAWPSHMRGDSKSHFITLRTLTAVKTLYKVILHTQHFKPLSDFGAAYIMSSDPALSIDDTVVSGNRLAQLFLEIETKFKSAGGKSIDATDEIFKRAHDEMLSFVTSLSRMKTRLVFNASQEPTSVAKQTYFNNRVPYENRGKVSGTSSVSSSKRPQAAPRKVSNIGFAGESDEDEPIVSTRGSTITKIEEDTVVTQPVLDVTPVLRTRGAPSATHSIGRGSVILGFADDSDDDSLPTPTLAVQKPRPVSTTSLKLSEDDVNDFLSIVSYMQSESEGETFKITDELAETHKSKVASTPNAMKILAIVREMRSNTSGSSVDEVLGFGDSGIIDMRSKLTTTLHSMLATG